MHLNNAVLRIRILIGSRFNGVPGSGFKRAKEFPFFEVLDGRAVDFSCSLVVLYGGLGDKYVNCNF
jgi:hypothetical protein